MLLFYIYFHNISGGLTVHLSYLSFTSSILMGFLFVTVATAEGTPDGLPPPMESVCDAESGAAYGLCNAYCQAMDCDSGTPNASEAACQKVANKFAQIAGRAVPCGPCPMYQNPAFPEFNELVSSPYLIDSCTTNWNSEPESLVACPAEGLNTEGNCNPLTGSTVWAAVWKSGTSYNGGDNDGSNPPTGLRFGEPPEYEDAFKKFEACKGLLQDAIDASGVPCTTY
jgi:hypothetical protein